MLRIKNILPIILLIFGTIGLISFFAISHIHSLRKLNQNAKEISLLYYDEESSKRAIEEEIKLSKFHKNMQAHTIRHLSDTEFEKENFENSNKKLRSLEESNIFNDVSIVDPSTEYFYNVHRWIIDTVKQFSSNIVFYPYFFQYTDNSANSTRNFSQGAYISLVPSELNPYNFSNMASKTNKTLSIKKARALFGTDIAILSVQGKFEDDDVIDYFYDGVDWCSYFGNIGKYHCFIDYATFKKQKEKNTSNTYVTRINETELINGKLMNGNIPSFRILIIPDFLYGVYERLKAKLTNKGFDRLKEFYEKGGIIFITGKSGVLFEDIGLISKGTYDRSKLLCVDNKERSTHIEECDSTYNKIYKKGDDDIEKQILCFTIKSQMKFGLSTTFLTKNPDNSFKTLLTINPNEKDLSITRTDDFVTYPIKEEEKKYLPFYSIKKNDKDGQLYLMNFNPMMSESWKNLPFNLLIMGMSRQFYLSSKVNMAIDSGISDLPIPAGEVGVNLQVKTTIHNLDDNEISNSKLYVFLPDNFGWVDIPKTCKFDENINLPENVLQKKTFNSTNTIVTCDIGSISVYERKDFIFTISILNYKATQEKYQVQILEPIAVLKLKEVEVTLVDYVKANCEAAPVLRVSANPDPSSFYPINGEGEYVDNVIKIENKEENSALEVEYTALIPLISPLLDADDQRKTDWALKIYVDYYNDFKFEVPLSSDNATDYIYTAYLQGKGSVIAAEWDSPVLPSKELIREEMARELKENIKQEVNISGINIGMITIGKTTEVIKQVNYRNSNRFYKLASQRLMVYIDDTTPEGAKALYGENLEKLQEEWKDPIYNDRAKKDFIFVRNDIYFYDNKNYLNPTGVTEHIVFSVDKLVAYEKNKGDCVTKRGDAKSQIIYKGYFNNSDSEMKKKILEPNVYSNALFEYCNIKVIDPTNEEDFKSEFGNLTYLRPVHYIIPNVEENITSAKQIYNFISGDGYNGYHKTYNSIKFIYLHSTNIVINAKTCLYGGRIIIKLNDLKLKTVDDVTVSPDQIAVFKTEYANDQILIYFRRGLMSNEQFGKDLNIGINIENLGSDSDLKLDLEIQEMKYDISIKEYEVYKKVDTKANQEFKYITAFSYPALEMKVKLDRDLNGYETIEPFSRYGTYSQEIGHRYVYGTAETHHEKKPGLTGNTGGFSLISNLGISSIPFIEYMTVGKGQVIPSGTSTARITWKDVWGRTWHQPIKSIFPDVPPIPPALKNLMMSTTYEILMNGKQIYEWPSDSEVLIHLHIKLLNNYPKYFEITRCKENEIQFVPKYLDEKHDREFSNSSSAKIEDNLIKNDNGFIRQGGFASYGVCYDDENAYVGGKKVEGEFKTQIQRAKLCSHSTDPDMIAQCAKDLENVTTLHRLGDKDKQQSFTKWNYSPRVESYYPKDYIEDDMWDLTHFDYDDDNMDKAYKYQQDNLLPNYDNKIVKPHNTIVVPIYKGLGYSITYNKKNTMNYHGTKKYGWWSDNLQNKDDTLLAGQSISNKISVDKKSSINNWINGSQLEGIDDSTNLDVKKIIQERNKNIYVCLFNQNRPKFMKNNKIKFAPINVNQNNIIPIIIDLKKDDPKLTNFNCNVSQYTPENIQNEEGNLLVTSTSKDYLYFAANLRGQAKESLNVLMNLKNFNKVKYEGMVKINEGGRFVYWNPANGPNSFLVVDNPVSIINSKRNDIEIYNSFFPNPISTLNSIVYHRYTFKDQNKINKIWPFDGYYKNTYGYGDVSVSVHVGGIKKSRAVINKGNTTYARIIFYNNCGFDWKMKGYAIESEEIDKKAIGANDLLEGKTHTIRKPLKYNFLEYVVEEKYKNFISIEPSDHNIEVAPELFDFQNINVVTIRDGFKGEYNLKIIVSKDFPDNLTGKPIEIKINLITSYFENFPGTKTDLTSNYHNYEVKIPSLYIAIPYSNGPFKGKVLYTSAYATDLDFRIKLSSDWEILGAKYVDENTLNQMLNVKNDNITEINQYWDGIKSENISFKEEISGLNKTIIFTGINEYITKFPIPKEYEPDVAEFSIVLKTKVRQIVKGISIPLKLNKLTYKNWINITKYAYGVEKTLHAIGPWVTLSYSKTLVERLPNGTFIPSINQQLTHEDEGIMRIYFLLNNIGNGNAYNTTYSIRIHSNLKYLECEGVKFVKSVYNETSKITELTFDLNSGIPQGQSKGGYIYVKYPKYIESYSALTPEELKGLPSTLQVANESETSIKLKEEEGGEAVTQLIRTQIIFNYQNNNLFPYLDLIVSGRRSNPNIEIVPKINKANSGDNGNILININKVDMTNYTEEINKHNQLYKIESIVENKNNYESVDDKPIKKEEYNKKHVVIYSLSVQIGNKITQNKLAYVQEDIGMSTTEVILIIISVVFYALSVFFIFLAIKNLKLMKNGEEILLEDKIKNSNLDELLNE